MKPAIWTTFTDAGGCAFSFSRVSAGVALVFIIACASYVCWQTKAMPELTGAGIFWGIVYGVNRAGEVTEKKFESQARVAEAASGNPSQTEQKP